MIPPLLNRNTLIRNGMVAEYKFNEGTGLLVHDYTGNGYNGVMNSQLTWLPQGIYFNNGAGYVNCGNIGKQIKTISFVFATTTAIDKNSSAIGFCNLIGDHTAAPNGSIRFGGVTGSLTNEIVTELHTPVVGTDIRCGWCDASESISANDWHVIDMTWSATQYVFYLDGVSKTTTAVSTPILLTVNNFTPGKVQLNGPSNFFKVAYIFLSTESLSYMGILSNLAYFKKEFIRRGINLN